MKIILHEVSNYLGSLIYLEIKMLNACEFLLLLRYFFSSTQVSISVAFRFTFLAMRFLR